MSPRVATFAGPSSPRPEHEPVPATVVITPLVASTRRRRLFPASKKKSVPEASKVIARGALRFAAVAGPVSPEKPATPVPATRTSAPVPSMRQTTWRSGWARYSSPVSGWRARFVVRLSAASMAGPPSPLPPVKVRMTASTRKLRVLRAPPAGAGLLAVTTTERAVVSSPCGTVVVTCNGLTTVAGSVTPPKVTVTPGTKPAPLMVMVVSPEPDSALPGVRLPSAAAGLLMVNSTPLLVPPPGAGVTTVTLTCRPVVSSAEGRVTLNVVALWYVVTSAVVPK